MDRFDLEASFMECWGTKDDISLICENLLDGKLSLDAAANALIGVGQMHQMRCEKAFDIFENLISSGQIVSNLDLRNEVVEEVEVEKKQKKKKK